MVRIVLNHEQEREIRLYEHEFRALCEAVRRDLRKEDAEAFCDDEEMKSMHRYHVRQDKHILEVLQPKTSRPLLKQPQASQEPDDHKIAMQIVQEIVIFETIIKEEA